MFSIIVCSHRPVHAAAVQAHYATLFGDHAHELILIDDAKSLCEGYTRGYEHSRGDLLIFSHDDVEFVTPDVPQRLNDHLSRYDMVGIAGTTRLLDSVWANAGDPHCFALVIYPQADGSYSVRYVGKGPLCIPEVQALDGCFIACRREVVATCGFDAATFDGFHLYDMDFTFRAYRHGFRLAVCRDLALIHASLGSSDDSWYTYSERFKAKFRGQLAEGAPGRCEVVSASVPREQLAMLCRPEYLQTAIRWS
jgi:GT2 family glycosyltransferase